MSWDLFVMELPDGVQSVQDIPRDYQPAVIGTRSELVQKIREIISTADFNDPSWGHIDGETYSIEVNIGKADMVRSFALHVRGGDQAVEAIAKLLDHLGLKAIVGGDGSIFTPENAVESFRRWRAYRDQVVGSASKRSPS